MDFSYSEFYEPNALMMEEEGAIIAGLLVGLNVIDANFCMKGEDLDSQVWEGYSVTKYVAGSSVILEGGLIRLYQPN